MKLAAYMAIPLLIAATGAGMAGCSAQHDLASSQYQTRRTEPRRDDERARKHNERGITLLQEGKLGEAEREFKKALTADITFGPAHNNLGKVYYHQNNMYLAAWEFEYGAKLMPHHPEARSNLGLVFERVGQLDKAVECYDGAVDLEPDNVEFLGNLARARTRRGDQGEEMKDLLTKLVARETRGPWLDWAKERLARMARAKLTENEP